MWKAGMHVCMQDNCCKFKYGKIINRTHGAHSQNLILLWLPLIHSFHSLQPVKIITNATWLLWTRKTVSKSCHRKLDLAIGFKSFTTRLYRLTVPQRNVCIKVERAKATVEKRVKDGERERERGEQMIKQERKLGNLGLKREWEAALEHNWLTEGYNDCHIAEH